jgi:hypothetical protein
MVKKVTKKQEKPKLSILYIELKNRINLVSLVEDVEDFVILYNPYRINKDRIQDEHGNGIAFNLEEYLPPEIVMQPACKIPKSEILFTCVANPQFVKVYSTGVLRKEGVKSLISSIRDGSLKLEDVSPGATVQKNMMLAEMEAEEDGDIETRSKMEEALLKWRAKFN